MRLFLRVTQLVNLPRQVREILLGELAPGMVLTVEPGLYIRAAGDVPERLRGIGVRIEDDVLVTEKGCEIITAATPKSIADIEALKRDAA